MYLMACLCLRKVALSSDEMTWPTDLRAREQPGNSQRQYSVVGLNQRGRIHNPNAYEPMSLRGLELVPSKPGRAIWTTYLLALFS